MEESSREMKQETRRRAVVKERNLEVVINTSIHIVGEITRRK